MVGCPAGADTMAGYRNAGERAIRIDMLERLADMLRGENSRSGFEANADMLSITGMTLGQFSDLMTGLGYKAEKGEREKVKATPVTTLATDASTPNADLGTAADLTEDAAVLAAEPTESTKATEATVQSDVPATEESAKEPIDEKTTAIETTAIESPEIEVFYTFTWGRPAGNNQRGRGAAQVAGKPRGKGKPQGKGGSKGDRKPSGNKSNNFSARPPKPEKKIDPDNPFAAALMGLRDGK
jgi:ATP-dependent RNA helicase SUPV3L1/SUV3